MATTLIRVMAWALVLLSAAVWCGGCASTTRGFEKEHADVGAQIRAANEELSRRLEAGDRLGVAAMYSDRGALIGPRGDRVEGRAAIDAYWQRFSNVRQWRLEVFELDGNERLVTQRGRSTIVWADPQHKDSTVEFMLIWLREEDGAWRIAVDAYW